VRGLDLWSERDGSLSICRMGREVWQFSIGILWFDGVLTACDVAAPEVVCFLLYRSLAVISGRGHP